MRIKSLVNAGAAIGSFVIGQEYELENREAVELIRIGFAVPVESETPPEAKTQALIDAQAPAATRRKRSSAADADTEGE